MLKLYPKQLLWIGSSRKDMQALASLIKRKFGLELFAAQCGEMPPSAKALKGFGGAGVLELVADDRSGTFRAVYAVKFEDAVYVLHVFQKKSKSGIATPERDIGLIKERLKRAQEDYAVRNKERLK